MLKLQIIGHLGHSARISTHEGKQVINFSLAHTERYKDKTGNIQEKTTWVDCTYWSQSTIHQYLHTGTLVYVEGTPFIKEYTGRDGSKKYSLSIRIDRIDLLKSSQQDSPKPSVPNTWQGEVKSNNLPTFQNSPPPLPAPEPEEIENDDLPF